MGERLTKGDVEKIKAEIEDRKINVRPKALEDLKAARAQGDLSENFEYYAAKRFNNQNNSRIRYLENVLKYATIIDDSSASDRVGINNTVAVHFMERNMDRTVRLVTSIRVNSRRNIMSIESPFGKAIMNKRVGDIVEVQGNDGTSYHVRIDKIENTPDDDSLSISRY